MNTTEEAMRKINNYFFSAGFEKQSVKKICGYTLSKKKAKDYVVVR